MVNTDNIKSGNQQWRVMIGMTKRTKKTSKSTESASKKRSRSSAIRSSESPVIAAKTTQKTASSRLDKVVQDSTFSSSSASEKSRKKKSSGLSQRENKHLKKSAPWQDYDYDNLPELSPEQLSTFKVVTRDQHARFKRMTAKGRRGRPKKPSDEKENIHSIRLSDKFLEKLKLRAVEKGFNAWQTYAKQVLAEDIDHGS